MPEENGYIQNLKLESVTKTEITRLGVILEYQSY